MNKMALRTSFIVVLIMCLGLTGCENLQKKFRRKKKETEVSNFVPVLQPEEYNANRKTVEEKYRHHYSLAKVWYKDIYAAIDNKYSDKRQRVAIRELAKQFNSLEKLLLEDGAVQMSILRARIDKLDSLFDEPVELRNYSLMVSELRQVEKVLRGKFKPELVKANLSVADSK